MFSAMNIQPKRLKRVVIKEELVALTGDYIKAVILNQFIYWSERIQDADKLIEEESERMKQNGQELNMKKQYGWIYKKAEELSEELMLGVSIPTIRRNIKYLVEKGWLHERRNPEYPWDKTLQYRVDFIQIMIDLDKLGYALEGYEKIEKVPSLSNLNFENSRLQNENSEFQNESSKFQNETAIPEITSEITSEKNELIDCMGASAKIASAAESSVHDEIFDALKEHVPKNCYILNNVPMGDAYINDIYLMLINQFPNQLSAEVVKIACERYFERACRIQVPEGVVMQLDIKNPVGFFQTCYKEAIQQYKANRRHQGNKSAGGNGVKW